MTYDEARAVQTHVQVLNAALVSLVELHQEYDATTVPSARDSIQRKAMLFHKTADEHEEEIERTLTEGRRDGFHQLMRERERLAGLPDDARWHSHRVRGHRDSLSATMHDATEIKR
jgi:hypothetical protein